MNPMKLLQFRNSWNRFSKNHPKFTQFIDAVSQDALSEGTLIEINVTTPDGKSYSSNLKLTKSDMELYREAQEHAGGRNVF